MQLLATHLLLLAATFPALAWERAPVDDIVNTSSAGVVRIEVSGSLENEEYSTLGSGVVITPDGYVVTAAHLIPDGLQDTEIRGRLAYENYTATHTPTPTPLRIDQIDYGIDVALLRFESPPLGMRALPLTAILPQNTQHFFVLGFAAGSNYMTRDDVIYQADPKERLEFRFEYHGIVNAGNSGGPILDSDGFVVGIHLGQKQMINGVPVTGVYLGTQTINFLLPENWDVQRVMPLFFPTMEPRWDLDSLDDDRWYEKDGEWDVRRVRALQNEYLLGRDVLRCGISMPSKWTVGRSADYGFLVVPPADTELAKYQLQLSETIERRPSLRERLERDRSDDYGPVPFGFVPDHNQSTMLLRMKWLNEFGEQADELVPFILNFHDEYYQIMKYFEYRVLPVDSPLPPDQNMFMARCNISNKAAFSVLMNICEDFMRQVIPDYFVEDNECVPGSMR